MLVYRRLPVRLTETMRVIGGNINKHRMVYHSSRPEKSKMRMAGMGPLCVSYLA